MSNQPRIIFAGTPGFAAKHLQGLHEAGFEIPLVLTQPDAKVGRGRKLKPTDVKAYAVEHGIPVAQPEKVKGDQEVLALLQEVDADWMVVVAYGLILPKAVLDIPRYGCLNVHGSILPRWRGAAPIQRAIEARDVETGICIMQMDEGLDTGPVRHQSVLKIKKETSEQLLDALAPLGVKALIEVLQAPDAFPPQEQSKDGVAYAEKVRKNEKNIDWSIPSLDLEAKIRALQSWPGVSVITHKFQFKLLQAEVVNQSNTFVQPGTITDISPEGIVIGCGDGHDRLRIERIQLAGSKPVFVRDFINGKPGFFQSGDFLSTIN